MEPGVSGELRKKFCSSRRKGDSLRAAENFGEQVVLKDSFESQTQTMSGQPAGKFGSK